MQKTEVQRMHFPPMPDNTAPLWAGIVGVPAVWSAQFEAVYALSHYACAHQQSWILHVVHIAGLILIGLGGIICLRYWRRQGNNQEDRTRFLASWGLMSSLLFFIATIAQMIAGWMLNPCAT